MKGNYISDPGILTHLSRADLFGSSLVFLPIARNGHWSLATADLRTHTIYHDDSMRGTHGTTGRNGATLLRDLLVDVARHMGIDTDIENRTCRSSNTLTMPQQTGTTDCGVFVCAYATLRQLDLECELFDQTHNQRMRLYIANVILANETLPLTQVHLRDIPHRQETTEIIGQSQQTSTLGAHDERKLHQ